MKNIRAILIIVLLLLLKPAFSEIINVGILSQKKITSFIFSPKSGSYAVYTDQGKLVDLSTTDILELSFYNNQIVVKSLDKDYGSFKKISFIGTKWKNSFKIKTNKPVGKIINYEDNLLVNIDNYFNYFRLINNIDINNYVAGVVEAEVGGRPPEEYFKLQSIICRTYALKNIKRHQAEGYSVCDRVHCQAYHGKPITTLIKKATLATKGIVIVDSDINLIVATFHSNCGGQTANSEDVWSKPLYYLRSVKDSFCRQENNANWTKKISKNSWINYLSNNYSYAKSSLNTKCGTEYFQPNRESFFINDNIKIPHTTLRKDWKLKSGLFDVAPSGDYVILKGKGFGHGVGLCQEGAMRMSRLGYPYGKILHFYYQDVHLIDLNYLDFFKEDL